MAFIVVGDPNNPSDRFLAPLKINIAAPPPILRFTITSSSQLQWTGLNERVDIQSILSQVGGSDTTGDAGEVDTFLISLLSDGPVVSEDVMVQAKENGFSRNEMFDAKRRLGVVAERIGGLAGKGVWVWKYQ